VSGIEARIVRATITPNFHQKFMHFKVPHTRGLLEAIKGFLLLIRAFLHKTISSTM